MFIIKQHNLNNPQHAVQEFVHVMDRAYEQTIGAIAYACRQAQRALWAQMMTDPQHDPRRLGFSAAIGAYLIWGFLPLYLILVKSVPPTEFIGWRIIWTLPICMMIVLIRGQLADLRAAFANRHVMLVLAGTSTLIGVNWLVYVWAIQHGDVYAASLGYYINPLVNVLLGTILLKERLTRLQWLAVAIAAVGVAVLMAGALTTLWISLTLAFTFGIYGLLRKQVPVGSLPGLTIESTILLLPACGIAMWYAASPAGSSFTQSQSLGLLIMLGGFLTAIPLLLFAIAARLMDYSTIGFFQFIAPTIVFVLGLTVFKQPLLPAQAVSFALIWAAIALFVWDLLQRQRAAKSV